MDVVFDHHTIGFGLVGRLRDISGRPVDWALMELYSCRSDIPLFVGAYCNTPLRYL
ncbi:hypothetical protein TRIP_C80042 [Candidatus Zixiibacteriota bacterium]|nr:hypothetical protein TRIP_C80042 [candidate division Zixibacteria bacterium]